MTAVSVDNARARLCLFDCSALGGDVDECDFDCSAQNSSRGAVELGSSASALEICQSL